MSTTPWNSIAESVVESEEGRLTYAEALASPCRSCGTAPCCSHLPLQTFKITNMVELDHAMYILNFDRMLLGLQSSGDWSIYYSYPCRFLNRETFRCDIHEAAERPQICASYSPFRCWYKKAFTAKNNTDFILIDSQRMESIIPYIVFDEARNIVQVPDWQSLIDKIASLPSTPRPAPTDPPSGDPVADTWRNLVLGLDSGIDATSDTYGYNDLRDLCNHCQGFCCQTLIFPVDTPASIANLDYLKFCLSFPGVELGIANGAWSLVVKTDCRHLKEGRCDVYNGPERPLICQHYDAWRCNYRIDFGEPRPQGFVRVTLPEFDSLAGCFRFDRNGAVVAMPSVGYIRDQIEDGWRRAAAQPEVDTTAATPV